MTLSLRPHHFLCLPGYKGYNYNQEQVNSWNEISKQLRDNPDTDVVIWSGKDDLCKKCPNDGSGYTSCNQDSLSVLDKKVQDMLGLVTGKIYKYSEVIKHLQEVMTPEKHKELCGTCQWWNLCEDTFEHKPAPFMSITSGGKIDPSKLRVYPKVA